MKILINSIRWIFGILLCIFAFTSGLFNGNFLSGLVFLVIGLLLLPPITKKLFLRKKTSSKKESKNIINSTSLKTAENTTEMVTDFDKSKQTEINKQKQNFPNQEITNYEYQPSLVQRKGIQLLESINILHTTKNIDTLKGRFDFISKMYDVFIEASTIKRYISDLQLAIDEYKTLYYDRLLNDFELELVLKK